MTEGRIFGRMLLFVLPLMATNVLQTLYNAADMMVVSLSSEPDAVGAIGITGPFVTMLVNIFIGFSTGANVIVARHLGSKNDTAASKAVHTSVTLSLIFGVIAAVVGVAVSRGVLVLMGAEGKLLDLATTYTVIYFLGMPFLSVTNYAVAIFRAKGDTRTPLVIMSLSGIVNVTMNVFFVLVCGLSVEGVAIATAAANLLSAVLLIVKLMREEGACHLDLKELKIDRIQLSWIVRIGLPAGLQGALFSISNILINSSILRVNNAVAPEGSAFAPVVRGNAAVATLTGFIYTATTAVYTAVITFTSQNAGAKKYDRVSKVMGCGYVITFAIAAIGSSIVFLLHKPLIALYGVTDGAVGTLEHIAYETAMARLWIETLPCFLCAFMDVGSAVVRGFGKSVTSMIIALTGSCLFRVVWLLTVFEALETIETIYVSYPISWTLTAIAQFVVAIVLISRAKRNSGDGSIDEPHPVLRKHSKIA